MHLYRIENIKLKPLLLIARDSEDAVNVLSNCFTYGMGKRPDADFDVVDLTALGISHSGPLRRWFKEENRGVIWEFDNGAGWELVAIPLGDP